MPTYCFHVDQFFFTGLQQNFALVGAQALKYSFEDGALEPRPLSRSLWVLERFQHEDPAF